MLSDLMTGMMVLGLIAAVILLAQPRPERLLRPKPRPERCRVTYVYDGDTIAMNCGQGEETARIIGLNAPETRDAECAAERALGKRATDRLRVLLATKPPTRIRPGSFDRYGRRLIRLIVGDGEDVADILIREGYAEPYSGGQRRDWCAFLER